MLNNIIRPEPRLEVAYGLRFFVDAGGGCEFPCDCDGNVLIDRMTDAAKKNYYQCLQAPDKYPHAFNEVVEYRRWIKDEPYGTCHCGEKVYLFDEYMGACQCGKCGQWYNLFGQELLSPEKWGLEEWDYCAEAY